MLSQSSQGFWLYNPEDEST